MFLSCSCLENITVLFLCIQMSSSSFCVNQWEWFTTDLFPTPLSRTPTSSWTKLNRNYTALKIVSEALTHGCTALKCSLKDPSPMMTLKRILDVMTYIDKPAFLLDPKNLVTSCLWMKFIIAILIADRSHLMNWKLTHQYFDETKSTNGELRQSSWELLESISGECYRCRIAT